jgi:acetyl-CoA synthetase
MHANLLRSNQTAIIWEGDEPGQNKYITYSELLKDICRIANVFKAKGVRKGDVVTIYMPMIPQ